MEVDNNNSNNNNSNNINKRQGSASTIPAAVVARVKRRVIHINIISFAFGSAMIHISGLIHVSRIPYTEISILNRIPRAIIHNFTPIMHDLRASR